MGTWGSGLYENDTTCDVKATYVGFLQEGQNNQEAYESTLEKLYEYIGDQDEPLLWFALAETQWSLGRLIPEVKQKALEWIEKKGGLELWLGSAKKGDGWEKTLQELKGKLQSPMPSEQKIKKPKEPDMNLWHLNDVYAYQFYGRTKDTAEFEGKYILLQKIGQGEDYTKGIKMRIHVFDKIFEILPSIEDLKGIRLLPLDFPTRFNHKEGIRGGYELCMSYLMALSYKSEYPEGHLTFIGNVTPPENKILRRHMYKIMNWACINDWVGMMYKRWHDIEYKDAGDGVYDFIPR